ncbi:MAG: hypothetical protein KF901_30315 [Myxococcales bacterium]|nr:hypothetical protein [Myxococcales bacterium]
MERVDLWILSFEPDARPTGGLARVFGVDELTAEEIELGVPMVVKSGILEGEAEPWVRALEALGARVELRPSRPPSIAAPRASLPAPAVEVPVDAVTTAVAGARDAHRARLGFEDLELDLPPSPRGVGRVSSSRPPSGLPPSAIAVGVELEGSAAAWEGVEGALDRGFGALELEGSAAAWEGVEGTVDRGFGALELEADPVDAEAMGAAEGSGQSWSSAPAPGPPSGQQASRASAMPPSTPPASRASERPPSRPPAAASAPHGSPSAVTQSAHASATGPAHETGEIVETATDDGASAGIGKEVALALGQLTLGAALLGLGLAQGRSCFQGSVGLTTILRDAPGMGAALLGTFNLARIAAFRGAAWGDSQLPRLGAFALGLVIAITAPFVLVPGPAMDDAALRAVLDGELSEHIAQGRDAEAYLRANPRVRLGHLDPAASLELVASLRRRGAQQILLVPEHVVRGVVPEVAIQMPEAETQRALLRQTLWNSVRPYATAAGRSQELVVAGSEREWWLARLEFD